MYLYVRCIFTFGAYLYALFLSCSLPLFLSLTIAYEVSLQNTNVLQSPWKQWEQRGGQGTVREFFYDVGTVTNALLISMCVYLCTSMAQAQYRVSKVLSFYFCELDEILPMIACRLFVCFPCTCFEGCAGWMPTAPPHSCQALLSCSWLSSQALRSWGVLVNDMEACC